MAHSLPIEQTRSYLDLFSHLSGIIAQTQDLGNMLQASVRAIESLLSVNNCSIMLLEPDGLTLTMRASSRIDSSEWPRIFLRLGEGVAGKVAAEGRPIRARSGDKADGIHQDKKGERKYRTSSFLSVPLATQHGLLGVINVTDRTDGSDLAAFDEEMLLAIGQIIAVAILNHRLYMETDAKRRRLSIVMEELPIGMFVVSADGRLTLWNRSARSYLDIQRNAEPGDPWESYFPDAVTAHLRDILRHISSGQNAYVDEFDVPNGPEGGRIVRISAVRSGASESSIAPETLFLVEDLHQVKELLDLRRSDQMKSNFLSLISHELRTPLASIKGAIHLLHQVEMRDMEGEADRIFDVLQRNSERLTHLINNILDALDLETRTLRLYRKHTDLHKLLARIAESVRKTEGPKKIQWDLRLAAADCVVFVDEKRVGQVMQHILENALKFAPESGTISIETRPAESNWLIRIANTGPRIEPSLHEKIFSKFFQADGTLTRYYGGTGLGLYLSREIIRMHGGEIRIDPRFEDGVCFELSLPRQVEPE